MVLLESWAGGCYIIHINVIFNEAIFSVRWPAFKSQLYNFVTLGKSHTPQLKPTTRQRFLMPFDVPGHVLVANNTVWIRKIYFLKELMVIKTWSQKGLEQAWKQTIVLTHTAHC